MAALVLVLQIATVGQRWLVSSIRIFAVQSFLLAAIAGTIAVLQPRQPYLYRGVADAHLEGGTASLVYWSALWKESESGRRSNR